MRVEKHIKLICPEWHLLNLLWMSISPDLSPCRRARLHQHRVRLGSSFYDARLNPSRPVSDAFPSDQPGTKRGQIYLNLYWDKRIK
ncbi:hypothetical protein PflA506_0163 [Pseudomonas fluorescens A506]|nr:hypothetical protein PflA506_0163 [Pseudomonas fluorescens A506]